MKSLCDKSLMRPQMQSLSLCFQQLRVKPKDTPVTPTRVTPGLGITCNITAPRTCLRSSSCQQETSKVVLEKTRFILDENKPQSLPKQIASEWSLMKVLYSTNQIRSDWREKEFSAVSQSAFLWRDVNSVRAQTFAVWSTIVISNVWHKCSRNTHWMNT